MASYENIIDTISNDKKGFDGQVSMFDLGGETQKEEIKYNYIIEPEYDEKEKLSMEKKCLEYIFRDIHWKNESTNRSKNYYK